MDTWESSEVHHVAWLPAVMLLLGVGGVLYAVFLVSGLGSTAPIPIHWWLGIASAICTASIVLIIRGTWV